jgi:hypothetical protein
MATLTKTQGIAILAHQAVTHPDTVVGSAQDVSTAFAATIFCFHAPVEATANTNSGSFLIQASASASGNEDWSTVARFQAGTGTPATEAMTATEPSGETVLAVASTTGFAASDKLYIQDTGTLADSEWATCQEIATDTSINLVDGLTTGKDSADVIWNSAEIFPPCQIDLTAIGRVRVVFMHEGATGANVHVKAIMVTGDEVA